MAQPNVDNMNIMMRNILEMTKTPEIIKLLPTFDGDRKFLHSWISQVDSILEIFNDDVRQTRAYVIWLKTIRSKIIGDAHNALVVNSVDANLTWPTMRRVLIEHFSDKRDLASLTQQIPYLRQDGKSVEEFYLEICSLTTDISQKLGLDPRFNQSAPAIMQFMQIITTNAFIDGLSEPLSSNTRASGTENLLEAYRVAENFELAYKRKREKNSFVKGNNLKKPMGKPKYPNNNPNIPQQVRNPFVSNENAKPSTSQAVEKPQNFQGSSRTRMSNGNQMSGISYRSNNRVTNVEEEEIATASEGDDDDESDVNFHIASLNLAET